MVVRFGCANYTIERLSGEESNGRMDVADLSVSVGINSAMAMVSKRVTEVDYHPIEKERMPKHRSLLQRQSITGKSIQTRRGHAFNHIRYGWRLDKKALVCHHSVNRCSL